MVMVIVAHVILISLLLKLLSDAFAKSSSLGLKAYLESVLLFLNKPDSLAALTYPAN